MRWHEHSQMLRLLPGIAGIRKFATVQPSLALMTRARARLGSNPI